MNACTSEEEITIISLQLKSSSYSNQLTELRCDRDDISKNCHVSLRTTCTAIVRDMYNVTAVQQTHSHVIADM